jgi:hypothetical protein
MKRSEINKLLVEAELTFFIQFITIFNDSAL